MKPETIVWTLIFVVAAAFLVVRAAFTEHGMGRAYVRASPVEVAPVEVAAEDGTIATQWVDVNSSAAAAHDLTGVPAEERVRWTRYEAATYRNYLEASAADPNQTAVGLSLPRSIGLWLAAFFTLAVFSFVYKDNGFYKFSESVFIGVSAAYWMVVGFWTVIVPNLFGRLWPSAVKAWAMPGLEAHAEWIYIVPLILGIMLLWRLMPVGGWISRWPLAFFIGVFCGLRLIRFLHADFLSQIRNTIMPIFVFDTGTFDPWGSLRNILIVGGVLTCLVYFFFSFEHKGLVGKTARVGIWILMITFGAGFGYTVMGRIALLAIRLEFLFDDWLWLIDPTGRRAVAAVGLLMGWG